jgi:cytochrome b
MIVATTERTTDEMTDTTNHDNTAKVEGTGRTVRVWDPVVRIFHWGLVAAFAIAYLTGEESRQLHEIAGYTVAALLAVRLVWGLVGSRYARLGHVLRGPGATLAYLGDMARGRERRYLGHNPAGQAMIVALFIALAGTACTGWLLDETGEREFAAYMSRIVAPAAADEAGDDDHHGAAGEGHGGEEGIDDLHEAFANLSLLLVAVHVGGVLFTSVRTRENLPRAMVTGRKRAPEPGDVT